MGYTIRFYLIQYLEQLFLWNNRYRTESIHFCCIGFNSDESFIGCEFCSHFRSKLLSPYQTGNLIMVVYSLETGQKDFESKNFYTVLNIFFTLHAKTKPVCLDYHGVRVGGV